MKIRSLKRLYRKVRGVRKMVALSAAGLVVAGAMSGTALAETSAVDLAVVADRAAVTAGSNMNLAILALDSEGQVDKFAESQGSAIMAVVTCGKGSIYDSATANPASGNDNGYATATAAFGNASALGYNHSVAGATTGEVQYVNVIQGQGNAVIAYPGTATGTDTIQVQLIERFVTDSGGVKFVTISTDTIDVTISSNTQAVSTIDILSIDQDANGVVDDDNDFADANLATASDNLGGVVGTITAGGAGAKIVASLADATGAAITSGNAILTLRPKTAVTGNTEFAAESSGGGNKAATTYTFTSSINNQGQVTFIIDGTVTDAGVYFMEVTMEGDTTGVNSVAAERIVAANLADAVTTTQDVLEVTPKGTAKGLKLSSSKATMSNDATANATATVTVSYVDEYGNKIGAVANVPDGDVTLTDSASKLGEFTVTFGAADATKTVAVGGNSADMSVSSTGTATITAAAVANSTVTASDPLTLKIVEKQLVAHAAGLGVHTGIVSPTAGGAYTAALFTVMTDSTAATAGALDGLIDDGIAVATDTDGVLASTDKIILTHMRGSTVLETLSATVASDDAAGADADGDGTNTNDYTQVGGIFKVASAVGDIYKISDSAGKYGELLFTDAVGANVLLDVLDGGGGAAAVTIAAGSPTVGEYVNAHDVVSTSLGQARGNANNQATINVYDNNFNVTDSNGNDVISAYTGTVSSVVANASTKPADFTVNAQNTQNDVAPKTAVYDTSFFTGADSVEFNFGASAVSALSLSDTILAPNAEGALNVQAPGQAPAGTIIPVVITSQDQSGVNLASTTGYSMFITGDLAPIVATGVSGAGAVSSGGTVLAAGTTADVLYVNVGSQEGDFTLTFRNGKGDISQDAAFTVTKGAATSTCSATALDFCTVESDCTGVGGSWDADAASCSASVECSATNLTACSNETECTDVGGVWDSSSADPTCGSSSSNSDGTTTASAVTSDGSTSAATFTGGVSDTDGNFGTSFAQTDSIDISIDIAVDADDVDKAGELFIVAGIPASNFWLQQTADGWVPFDLTVDGLIAFETKTALTATETLVVANDLSLDGVSGDVQVFVAYTNADGKLVYNSAPFTFSVQ